jgi:hypothetical protein
MKSQISSPKWNILLCQNQDPQSIFSQFDAEGRIFDLVFSDGAYQTRYIVANLAMQRNVQLVILHDAEQIWYYKWNLLDITPDYARYDFRHSQGARKVTTILANEQYELIEKLAVPDHERVLLSYSSPRQPILQFNYASIVRT